MTSWVMNRENGLDPEERKDERKIDKNENEQKYEKEIWKNVKGGSYRSLLWRLITSVSIKLMCNEW